MCKEHCECRSGSEVSGPNRMLNCFPPPKIAKRCPFTASMLFSPRHVSSPSLERIINSCNLLAAKRFSMSVKELKSKSNKGRSLGVRKLSRLRSSAAYFLESSAFGLPLQRPANRHKRKAKSQIIQIARRLRVRVPFENRFAEESFRETLDRLSRKRRRAGLQ